jgi:ubiquinone biosynthesis protein
MGQGFGSHLGSLPVSRTLADELFTTLPVLRRLPRRVDRISAALEQNRLGLNVRLFADERDRRFVTELLNQVLVAFFAAAAGVIAALLLGTTSGPALTSDVSLFQVFGYNLLLPVSDQCRLEG